MRTTRTAMVMMTLFLLVGSTRVEAQLTGPAPALIDFVEETLPNGLRVIYAPLMRDGGAAPVAPVVHVRVLYHVGSRDERPDRQGFAHMFEHMMFRGSAHVAPEQHMKMVNTVGGMSNAFTSFDQTVYINTVPSEHLETVLWLEADRMASFKVSEEIYKTERKVVAEEWRMRQNQPYGGLMEAFLKNAFTTHSYNWTPIGNMDHLRAAQVAELQDFFNTYYVPNNAVLVVSGDVDVEKTREMVNRFYAWIPRGEPVVRAIPAEPKQLDVRKKVVPENVPLPVVFIGFHAPTYDNDDVYALNLLSDILGEGRSNRLANLLVNNADPMCSGVSSPYLQLEDGGIIGAYGMVLPGKNADDVEKILLQALEDVRNNGVTQAELDSVRTRQRLQLIKSRETAEAVANNLGREALFAGDASRVNTEIARMMAVTPDDVRRVADKYFHPLGATILHMVPDPMGIERRKTVTQASQMGEVAPSTRPTLTREINFPEAYPKQPPVHPIKSSAEFAKGTETIIQGVRTIVLTDSRLPTVNFSLTIRRGSDSDPAGKRGVADVTGELLRRGAAGMNYEQLNEDLESRGISLGVAVNDDNTRLTGACTSDQLEHAIMRARQLLLEPTFPEDEFNRIKTQTLSGLKVSRESPTSVAEADLAEALYGESPAGRAATMQSVGAITLEDCRTFYQTYYKPQDAVLMLAGDVTVEKGQTLAGQLVSGWTGGEMPAVDYTLPEPAKSRRIIVVNRPDARQATVRMGVRAYTIEDDQKFAGNVSNVILTSGIDSRLGQYVRANKGLAYTVWGLFQPGRHDGAFAAGTETAIESTPDTVRAMWDVFERMRKEEVTPVELANAQSRVAGQMVMQMQTIGQQASFRVEGILNGYPADYYDKLPSRVAAVTIGQVRDLMSRYVHEDQMTIVVVAPALQVTEGLGTLGEVEIVPMPALRDGEGATTQPTGDSLLRDVK